jgi:ElaB/YqjD/DUF883 family membrane-anchored ribosome-binding protein
MSLAEKRIRATKAIEDKAESGYETVRDLAGNVRKDVGEMGENLMSNAQSAVASVSDRMKQVGIDPDVMTNAAKDQATLLQQFIAEELKTRPVRALGVAAALGLVVGLLTTR